jgi:microcystin-dependent protein
MSDLRGHTDPAQQYVDRIAGYDQRLQNLERSHTHPNQTPVGSMVAWPGPALPALWAYCDGSSYSASAYPDLFNAIGYTWGGSAGTFRVPDLRSRTLVGQGQGAGLSNRALAGSGGEETVALTAAQTGAHNHVVAATTAGATAQHTHAITNQISAQASADHTHSGTTAGQSQTHTHSQVDTTAAGSRTTGVNSVDHTHTFGTSGMSANHTHALTGVSDGASPDHGHNFNTTSDAGGTSGAAHDNMPPFAVVSWIIRILPH